MAQQTTSTTTVIDYCRSVATVVSALATPFSNTSAYTRRLGHPQMGILQIKLTILYVSIIDGALPCQMYGPTEEQTLVQKINQTAFRLKHPDAASPTQAKLVRESPAYAK